MSNSIESIARQVSPPIAAQTKNAPDELGKEDFLRLLIAQMQHQDPLNPQDPTEYTAQLTQFSSLEQLLNINKSLSGLDSLQSSNQRMMAASAIGQRATVSGEQLTLDDGSAAPVRYTLSASSAATQLNIYNEAGTLVNSVDLGARDAGAYDYQWNGLDQNGNQVADGAYTFEVLAVDYAGNDLAVNTSFSGLVTGVKFENNRTLLRIDGGYYPMEDVSGLEMAN